MIIDFLTVNLKNALNDEIGRAQSAETALKSESFAGAEYDSSATTINFYNGFGDKIAEIDATDFVIDGMIENVTLSGTILTITFNTAAGKEDIEIDLSEFINPENYYTKTEIDTRISEVERVTSSGYNELHTDIVALSGQAENFITSGAIQNFVTSAQVETQITGKNYVTSAQVETQITSKNYVTSGAIQNFVTSAQVETQITGKNYVTSGDVESQISGKNYVTSADVETQITNKGYATTGDIQNFITSAQVETQITSKNYVTSGDVQTQITSAMTDSVYSTTIHNIVSISQADYDLLPVKDPNTLYVIIS